MMAASAATPEGSSKARGPVPGWMHRHTHPSRATGTFVFNDTNSLSPRNTKSLLGTETLPLPKGRGFGGKHNQALYSGNIGPAAFGLHLVSLGEFCWQLHSFARKKSGFRRVTDP